MLVHWQLPPRHRQPDYNTGYYHDFQIELTRYPETLDLDWVVGHLVTIQANILERVYGPAYTTWGERNPRNSVVYSFSILAGIASVNRVYNTPWHKFRSEEEMVQMLTALQQSGHMNMFEGQHTVLIRVSMINPDPSEDLTDFVDPLEARYHVSRRTTVAGYVQNIEIEELSSYQEVSGLQRKMFQEVECPKVKNKPSRHVRKRQPKKIHYPVSWNNQTKLATQSTQVGAYELLDTNEKKLYLKSIEHVYGKRHVTILNPETETLSCFLMAFIRSEAIRYDFNQQNKLVNVSKLGVEQVLFRIEAEERLIYPVHLNQWMQLDRDYSFVARYDDRIYLRLFNTYYPEVLEDREMYFWELAAIEVEFWMSQLEQNEVNVNDMQNIGQRVADFFQVCVGIYDVENKGNRVWAFTPNQVTLEACIQDHKGFTIVNLLYDHGHMYPILDNRKFTTISLSKSYAIWSFCPICGKIGTSDGMKTKAKAFAHIQKCYETVKSKSGLPCYTKDNLVQDIKLDTVKPVKPRWQKKGSQSAMSMMCIYCTKICHTPVDFLLHDCLIQRKSNKTIAERIPNEKLWVYDLECSQEVVPNTTNVFYHVCNCVCARMMYPRNDQEKEGLYFANEIEFLDYVHLAPEFQDTVWIAHNGGGYDHHFWLRYAERMNIEHDFTPSPNSDHRYLKIHFKEKNIILLDFVNFVTDSLKNIAISFNLPVTKGDFPHRFNKKVNESYIGPVPSFDHEEDYWLVNSKKSSQDVRELKEFYDTLLQEYCNCEYDENYVQHLGLCLHCYKPCWDFQENLKKYCMLDVVVLAEACKMYRDKLLDFVAEEGDFNWIASSIDPFLYMTLPQLGLQMLLNGFKEPLFHNAISKERLGQTVEGLFWLEQIMKENPNIHIYHRGNWIREYYDYDIELYVDGFDEHANQCYFCFDCTLYPCEKCCYNEIFEQDIPHPRQLGITYKEAYDIRQILTHQMLEKNYILKDSCTIHLRDIPIYQQKCYEIHTMEEFFKGGRTEVFQPFVNFDCLPGKEAKYIDVCSLYPEVCAKEELPFGPPQYILGDKIDPNRLFHQDHLQKYWGYIRCKVKCPQDDLLGLLPMRDPLGRLTFPVVEEMEGCWGLNELELAWQNGYDILEIYEIIHWDPEKRSNNLFKGYVDYFLKGKQQSEGWRKLGATSATPTEEEMLAIAQQLYESNGLLGMIDILQVRKDDLGRKVYKTFLNSVWGKFAQKVEDTGQTTLYSHQQFLQFWHDKRIRNETCQFRRIGKEVFKVSFKYNKILLKGNSRGNMYLAAKVTEHARCRLHRQAIVVGPPNIMYCDTDSLIIIRDIDAPSLTGIGLGKWTDEYPNKKIRYFIALAPKCYFLLFYESDKLTMKAKGIQLTLQNQEILALKKLQELMENKIPHITLNSFSIFANCQENLGVQYGVLLSRYGVKFLHYLITKRVVQPPPHYDWENLPQIRSFPIGYVGVENF